MPRNWKSNKKLIRRSIQQAERRNAARSDEESAKKLAKSSEATFHRPCRAIMSSHGARGSPERAPGELLRIFLGAEMELGEAQKSSPEDFESVETDLKMKSLDISETIDKSIKMIDF